MLQVSSKHLKFFRQVFVIGVVAGRNGISTRLHICQYLHAIAIRRGNGIGETAFEVHQHAAALEKQEHKKEQYGKELLQFEDLIITI